MSEAATRKKTAEQPARLLFLHAQNGTAPRLRNRRLVPWTYRSSGSGIPDGPLFPARRSRASCATPAGVQTGTDKPDEDLLAAFGPEKGAWPTRTRQTCTPAR